MQVHLHSILAALNIYGGKIMKKITQLLVLFVLAVLLVPSVMATDNSLKKIDINTCTGSGDLYVYQGDQYQEPDTSFKVDNNQLLIFTKANRVSSIKVDGVTPSVVSYEPDPFYVKVYKADVTPGDTVHIDATTDWQNARGIQGYFVQDASNPVYNVANIGLTYDGEKDNLVYLKPGTYQYIFYDKYDKTTQKDDDSRELTVKVTNPSNQLTSTTYTKPNPVGTQGTVVHEFTAVEEGYYKIQVDTEDSIWWILFDCAPKQEEICENADVVIPVDLGVVGEDCHWSNKISDTENINIPASGEYYATGYVERGDISDYPDYCQDQESFYISIEGQNGPEVEDDAESCKVFRGEQHIGNFNLDAGLNKVDMYTTAKCPPDESPNSVRVKAICLYSEDNEVPEFGIIGAVLAVAAIGGFVIFRRRK